MYVRIGGRFKHMLYISTIYPNISSLAMHDSKRHVEEALVESCLPFTIIQPGCSMDTISIGDIIQNSTRSLWTPYDLDAKFSFTAPDDLVEAVAIILAKRNQHMYATFQLCSTLTPMTFRQAAFILSHRLGREVLAKRISIGTAVREFSESMDLSQMDNSEARACQRNFGEMVVYFNHQGLPGNSNVLEMLLV